MEKTSWNVKTGRIMGVACLEFRGENFRRWLKNRKIRESFLPRKFPAIRYVFLTNLTHLQREPLFCAVGAGAAP